MADKILLIDGYSILSRAFYGVPLLTASDGTPTNGIFGFFNILFKLLEEEKPTHLTVAFDVKAPTFRHQMYDAYKGTRKPMPQELLAQVPVLKDLLHAMDIPTAEKAGYEADDVLGTLARQAREAGLTVKLVSGDRDMLQLARDDVEILIPKTKRGGTVVERYYPADVEAIYGVTPEEFIDVKALMGDSSDNIPGVPGIGEKTASALISTYHSIENVYEHRTEIRPPKAARAMEEHYDLARMSYDLAKICTEAPVTFDEPQARLGNIYTEEALRMVRRLELRTFLKRFADHAAAAGPAAAPAVNPADTPAGEAGPEKSPAADRSRCEAGDRTAAAGKEPEADAGSAPAGETVADVIRTPVEPANGVFRVLTTEEEVRAAADRAAAMGPQERIGLSVASAEDGHLCGVAAALPEETVFFGPQGALSEEFVREMLGRIAGSPAKKCLAGLKEQLPALRAACRAARTDVSEEAFRAGFDDVSLMLYLLQPLSGAYGADRIAREALGEDVPSQEELWGKKTRAQAAEELDQIALVPDGTQKERYWMLEADAARRGAPALLGRLASEGMDRLYTEIEQPLVFVLADMEAVGVEADRAALQAYSARLAEQIGRLESEIYDLCGETFNINSPKQLGEILFEKMGLPGKKKTKSGYSTAADVLEKLAPEHPVVEKILEYRTYSKLKSTYADGLQAFIGPDGRIHGKFHQMVTATGRLSSSDPNLQNIPVRIPLGRELRKVFRAQEGCVFLDADYSQIELRVLAHMSGDESLIAAYNSAQDIHALTASQVFHVPLEDVTPALRRNAKAVNFGIVYGISAFGLSEDLSISRQEAADYIRQYFETYPSIKSFLDGLVKQGKDHGYVTTMYGRRRPIPELSSSNFMQRSFGERAAMNSPIQGTAADIMKIAMLRVDRALREAGLSTRIVLQVHDELILEAPAAEADEAAKILGREMKAAAQLRVSLEADVSRGSNWYETK